MRLPRLALVATLATSTLLGSASPPAQTTASLRLSAAPIRLEYPDNLQEWAIRLASYADAAAGEIASLTSTSLPAGALLWRPATGAVVDADAVVIPGAEGVEITAFFTQVAEDYGVGYAFGYAKWVAGYAVARLAVDQPGGSGDWARTGAALYLTDVIARRQRATVPILWGIEGAFVRAAQRRTAVTLDGPGPLDAPRRGKAYATFKLLEAVYGQDAVLGAVGAMIGDPGLELTMAMSGAGAAGATELLDAWRAPEARVDVGLERVDLRDELVVRGRLTRRGGLALPVRIEVEGNDGQVVAIDVPASVAEREDFEIESPSTPVEVRVDPDGLLPDVNRANNRHGFGDAAVIDRFFAFDTRFDVGELEFAEEVALDPSEQRVEEFSVAVRNLTDTRTGLGFLVSAEWLERAERVQRAYFINLAPGEERIIHESLAYPNRGNGVARIEARYWEAPDADTLTDRLLSADPGVTNAYIVTREAPPAPRRPRRGIDLRPPEVTETRGEETSPGPANGNPEPAAGNETAATPESGPASEGTEGDLRVRLVSPTAGTVPIGEVTLEASVLGPQGPDRVDFYVNERRIGAAMAPPYRLQWGFPDGERVFVIRAVAVVGDRIASDDVVLDRSTVGFGSTVDLVTLHATVRDPAGRLARDLTADDFRVIEDGTEQELVQFEFGEIPVSTLLMLDTSSSMIGGGIRAERAGAARLVESLVNDANRAMVLGFNDRLYLYAGLTSERDRLERAIAATLPDGSTALFDTLAEALRKANRASGKRALVVLSDGLDTNSEFAYADVLEYVRQSDVLVYTIGLQLMHEGTELGDASGAVKRGADQLRSLAEVTGGVAYFPLALEELEEIYGLIADELNSQYALSYYPTNQRFDGRWRELEVRLEGRPTHRIQVRPGYYGVPPQDR